MSLLSSTPVVCPGYLLAEAKTHTAAATAIVNAGALLPMQSAKLASEEGLVVPILVGQKAHIVQLAKDIDWDISNIRIVDAGTEDKAAEAAVALARAGEVASLTKGDIHTNQLLKAVINKQHGLRTKRRLSHVFHMSVPYSDASICITDAVINIRPDITNKLHIARNATGLLHALGNKCPKIAVLSAVEIASPSMPSSMEAAEVVKLAEQGEVPGALVGGPFAFDNAVSPMAAKLKRLDHPVAGNADVILVPNVETGNALFKQMVYFMGAAAAGIVLGAAVPIILTSRADPPASRLAATALASIYTSNTA